MADQARGRNPLQRNAPADSPLRTGGGGGGGGTIPPAAPEGAAVEPAARAPAAAEARRKEAEEFDEDTICEPALPCFELYLEPLKELVDKLASRVELMADGERRLKAASPWRSRIFSATSMLPLLRAMLVVFLCSFVVQIYNVSILTPRVADFVDLVDFVYLDSEIASGGLSMDATETAPIIYIGDYVIVRSSSGDYFGGVRNATEYFQWFPYTAGEGTLNTVNTVLDVQHWVRYSAESLAAMSADFIAAGSRNSDYGGRNEGHSAPYPVGYPGFGYMPGYNGMAPPGHS